MGVMWSLMIYESMNNMFLHSGHPVVCHFFPQMSQIPSGVATFFPQGRFGWYLCVLVPKFAVKDVIKTKRFLGHVEWSLKTLQVGK